MRPIARNLAGLAEVSFGRQSRLDLLLASITARDPNATWRRATIQLVEGVIAYAGILAVPSLAAALRAANTPAQVLGVLL